MSSMHGMKTSRTISLSLESWAFLADIEQDYQIKNLDGIIKVLKANWRKSHE